jgi:uroporphyrinogen-III synthase
MDQLTTPFSLFLQAKTILLTSPRAVAYFFDSLALLTLEVTSAQCILAIGQSTAKAVDKFYRGRLHIASEATQEGVVAYLQASSTCLPPYFYPRSSLARPYLRDTLHRDIIDCPLYTTLPCAPKEAPSSSDISACVFTSPSTVHSFRQFFPESFLEGKTIYCQGPITKLAVEKSFSLAKAPLDIKQLA